jgi:hypothetical protein
MELPEGKGRLERMRDARLSKLRQIGPVLAGSLSKRKDQSGYYLTDKVSGKTRTMHVSEQMYEAAQEWNDNHKKAKELLEELSEIQRALIRAEGRDRRKGESK